MRDIKSMHVVLLPGLVLQVGHRGGHCYRVRMEPERAAELGWDLIQHALRAYQDSHPVLDELRDLLSKEPDDDDLHA